MGVKKASCFSLARAKTNYNKWKSATFDRFLILEGIITVLGAKNLLKLKAGGFNLAAASFGFGASTWMNICFAHAFWNQKEERYSLVERRTIDREQVEGGYRERFRQRLQLSDVRRSGT